MFGFLNPRPHSRGYRRVYARLCQHQRRYYGMQSLPFHSFEAVFLFQCALEAGAFPLSVLPDVRCCRLAAPCTLNRAADAAVGRFCASVGLLLASIKLDDDVQDSGAIPAKLARWVLKKRFVTARRYFATLDDRFGKNIEQLLADHQRLEKRGGTISLAEYAEPTALAFGYVFGLLAKLPNLGAHQATFTALGRHVGAALITYDCAVDWERDRQRKEFNPLPDEAAILEALLFASAELRAAEALAKIAFGEHSQAAETLQRVIQRVARQQTTCCPAQPVSAFGQAKRVVRLALLPVFASSGGQPPTEKPNENIQGEQLTGDAAKLPGGIENVNQGNNTGKKREACCDGCYCGGDCCQCGVCAGDACAGADCCAGLECCACA